MKLPKRLIVEPKLTEKEADAGEGQFFDEEYYDHIINYDADVYYYNSTGKLVPLFFFRKGIIDNKDLKTCIQVFKADAMKASNSRGIAGGPIDPDQVSSNVDRAVSPDKFKSKVVYKDGSISKYYVSNRVNSLIAGYFDKPKVSEKSEILKMHKIPCRTTAFTEQNFDKWVRVLPMIQKLDTLYSKFAPDRHAEQLAVASATPDFQIENTAFSTVTVNYNWRTACHKDSGDYHNGLSVIIVATEGDYHGGYLGYPKFKIAVDVRNGDFILKDPHQYHCNTKLEPLSNLPFTRLSMIFYYREKINKCTTQTHKIVPKITRKSPNQSQIQTGGALQLLPKTKINVIPKRTNITLELQIRPETTDIKVIDEVLVRDVYEKQKLNFYIETGETWLDLGGNIGTFSLLALSHGCKVITYEPEPDNLNLLKLNLEHNFTDSTKWKIIPKAIGIKNGLAELYLCKGDYNKYRHTLHSVRGRKSIKVPLISFKEEMNKYKPTGVKIDIEGTEIDILENTTLSDWQSWGTKKLVFEYSFDVDPYIPRFLEIINNLRDYFNEVHYTKVKEDEEYYNHFPAATMVYCIKY